MISKDSVHLRKLTPTDAPFMLEWMHDGNVTKELKTDFSQYTIDDCFTFIESAQKDEKNLHYAVMADASFLKRAVVQSYDEYLGTVSLKHISYKTKSAEFAIVIRANVQNCGVGTMAMKEIIQYGFDVLELERIYWCVKPSNTRAISFYERNDYTRAEPENYSDIYEVYTEEEIHKLIWYEVVK